MEPYLLSSSPSLLSVGMRCQGEGWSFIWIGGKSPCFISPGGYRLTLLQVELGIPYLYQGTTSTTLSGEGAEVDDNLEAVGLRRWHGKLALDLDVEVQESAAPAVCLDEERAAEMGMSQADVIKELGDDTVVVSVGFNANDGGTVPPPPAAEHPSPPHHKEERATEWNAHYRG